MRSFLLVTAIFIFCLPGIAQSYAVETSLNYGFPALWKVSGDTPNGVITYYSMKSPSVGAEYQFESGWLAGVSFSSQRDKFHFYERLPEFHPSVNFFKMYRSYAMNLAGGYKKAIGSTPFSVFGKVGIGVGWVKGNQVIDTLNMDLVWQVIDHDGSYFLDTVQMHHSVSDRKISTLKLKAEVIVGIEYSLEHLFFRASCGLQSWLGHFNQIQYHAFHTSEHYDIDQTSDGNFNVRPGYFTCGIGVGWRFNE